MNYFRLKQKWHVKRDQQSKAPFQNKCLFSGGKVLTAFLTVALLGPFTASASSSSQGILCDFSGIEDDSKVIYTPKEVRDCFNSVDFRHGDYVEAITTFDALMNISATAELYNARFDWKKRLEKLKKKADRGRFKTDLQFQQAMTSLIKLGFKNGHYSYQAPACYTEYFRAIIPLQINSMIVNKRSYKPEQIIYIEPREILVTEKYQEATGIDVTKIFGKRIVKINGKPAIKYLQNYARSAAISSDDNDGNLFDRTLDFGAPFVISFSSLVHDIPDQLTLTLQSKDGHRQKITLPYIMVDLEFGTGFTRSLPASVNEADFVAKCYETFAEREARENGLAADSDEGDAQNTKAVSPNMLFDQDHQARKKMPEHKKKMRMVKKMKSKQRHYRSKDFREVPERLLGKFVTEVVPADVAAQGLQYKNDTTVLKLSTFLGLDPETTWAFPDPEGSIVKTLQHACTHSDRLIIDLRNNGGGSAKNVEWLVNHLFPVETSTNNRLHFTSRISPDNPRDLTLIGHRGDDLKSYADSYTFFAVWLVDLFGIPGTGLLPIERYPISGFNNSGLSYSLSNPTSFELQPGTAGSSYIHDSLAEAPPSVGLFNLTEVEQEAAFVAGSETIIGQELVAMPPDLMNPSNIDNIFQPTWLENTYLTPRGYELLRPTVNIYARLNTWLYQDVFYSDILGVPLPPRPYNSGIACPGKFQGERLIIVTNGNSASSSFVTSELLRDRATLVTTGGILGKQKGLATARGGPVLSASEIQARIDAFNSRWNAEDYFAANFGGQNTSSALGLLSALGLPLSDDALDRAPWSMKDFLASTVFQNDAEVIDAIDTNLPQINFIQSRGVDISIERFGQMRIIDEDTYELLDEQSPLLGDTHADVWTTDDDADGYVYRKVIRAVKERKYHKR